MKHIFKSAAALATLALAAVTGHAQANLDLVVGFAQSGAANDVLIDFGTVTNYSTPGAYNLGNYSSILSTSFTNWNTGTLTQAVKFGAIAGTSTNGSLGKANPIYMTSHWNSGTNATSLGVANSADFTGTVSSQINSARTSIGNVDTGYGAFTTAGVAKTIAASSGNSFTFNANPFGSAAYQTLQSTQVNTSVSDLANNGTANFAAADIWQISYGTPSAGLNQTFLGTLAVYQNGDVFLYTTPTALAAIPEPSTYAALLGLATLGFVAIRRRHQAALEII